MNPLKFVLLLMSLHGLSEGSKCSNLDSCKGNKAFSTCSCDEDCDLYGICCSDAESFLLMKDKTPEFKCYEHNVQTPVFVKETCTTERDSDVCSRGMSKSNFQLSNVLVSSRVTYATYRNRECAFCNDEKESDLIPWTSQLTCPSEFRFPNGSLVSITKKDILEQLTYDQRIKTWGLPIGEENFLHCDINFYQPSDTFNKLRYCAANMISDCPSDYRDNETAWLCRHYHAERKHRTRPVYFKNLHCALCNDLSLMQLDCVGRQYGPIVSPSRQNIVRVILEEWKWTEVTSSGKYYQCHYSFSSGSHCEKLLPTNNLLVVNSAHTHSVHFTFLAIFLGLMILNKHL